MHFATIRDRRRRFVLAALLIPALPAAATAQLAAGDSSLIAYVSRMARQRAAQLSTGAPPTNAASLAQYREALADMERGNLTIAAAELTAALQRAPQNALFRGDRAYVYALMGHLDEAATEYTGAYQVQQQNAWYLAGVAVTRGAQHQWAQAAGTIQLAVQTDSTVADSVIAGAAAAWFEQAVDRTAALTWARMAVEKNPLDAPNWLRISMVLRARQDSTPEGEQAVRRYLSLSGEHADTVAYALLADHLYNRGQIDSALALVAVAAQDSAYREFASQLYLQAGRDAFQHRDIDRTMALLARGRTWSTPAQQPAFSNITGRAQLLKLSSMLAGLEQSHSCEAAHAADSLATRTEQSLQEGVPFDSARTVMMLTSVMPGIRQGVQSAIANCRPAGQAAPPPPRRRPAAAPAPRRP